MKCHSLKIEQMFDYYTLHSFNYPCHCQYIVFLIKDHLDSKAPSA